jgi:hypothetical protein
MILTPLRSIASRSILDNYVRRLSDVSIERDLLFNREFNNFVHLNEIYYLRFLFHVNSMFFISINISKFKYDT